MFKIQGDEILFQGVKFAVIESGIWPTQRDRAQEQIEIAAEWEDLAEEHEKEVDAAYQKGYQEAEEMMQRMLDQAKEKITDLESQISELELDLATEIGK